MAGHHVQQGLCDAERGLRAADHDEQITLPGADGTTGNGSIDDLDTGRLQTLRPVLHGGRADGGHQQHNAARFERRGGLSVPVEHRFGLLGGGDHQHQHIGVDRRVTDGGRGFDAVGSEGRGLLRVDVESGHGVPGPRDAGGHGAAHGAQTDPSDVRHIFCFLLRVVN